jgi:hypothetical protein
VTKYERIGSETDLEAMLVNSESSSPIAEQLKQERNRLRLLLDVNNAAVSTLHLRELLRAVSNSARRVVPRAGLKLLQVIETKSTFHLMELMVDRG